MDRDEQFEQAARGKSLPSAPYNNIGFRCAGRGHARCRNRPVDDSLSLKSWPERGVGREQQFPAFKRREHAGLPFAGRAVVGGVPPRGRLLVRAVCMVFDRYLREKRERATYSKVI